MLTTMQLKKAKQAGLSAPAASAAAPAQPTPAGQLPETDEDEEPKSNALDSLFGQARPALQKLRARGLPQASQAPTKGLT